MEMAGRSHNLLMAKAYGGWSGTAALSLLETTVPGAFGGPIRQTCGVDLAEGSTVFSFNTSDGSQHITQSISTSQKKAPAGKTAPDLKGAINATEKGYHLPRRTLEPSMPTCR